ncbi:MAG TPA: HAD-IA family hydrolase [Longilinea sp.]|nr:HAD-IA family hydrolase [Longilinea sp.]
MTIRGLIFDFDGLILDTETPCFQSWQEEFQRNHVSLTLETYAKCLGTSPDTFDLAAVLSDMTGKTFDNQKLRAAQRQRERELVLEQEILPGVLDYLAEAKSRKLKLAVASSSERTWVHHHLERLGLQQYFDAIFTADDVPHAKPDPALYNVSLSALQLKPEEVIAFEDSPNGIAAARAAAIYCVAIPNQISRQLDLSHASRIIPSLKEIPLQQLIEQTEPILTPEE